MFDAIRRHTRSYGTYILVTLLIVIFALFFGSPSGRCGEDMNRFKIAKVGKRTIYTPDLNIVYGRAYGSVGNTPEEEYYKQRAASLRLMIVTYLLADRANDMDLRVSDDELKEYLTNPLRNREYAYYNRDGKFSGLLYKNYVQHGLGVLPSEYEAYKRTELLASKYIDLLVMQGAASKADIEAEARLKSTKVNLEFIKLDPKKLIDDVTITPEEISSFEKSNSSEIETYYNDHISDYTKPEQLSVRRIYIPRPDASEGDDAVDAANKKWEDAKKRVLESKEDIAAVAKELSADYAKENGGLIDFTDVDNMDQDIVKALQGAAVGDIKEVLTDSSYMLVKLEGRKEKVVTPLASVKNDIAKTLLQEARVSKLVNTMSSEFAKQAATSKTFEDALTALQNRPEPEALPDKKPSKDKKKEEAQSPEKPNPWKDISVETTGDFSQAGRDLSSMFGGQMANIGISGPWDDVPNVGKSPELVKAAFALTTEKPLIEKPMVIDGSTFLFRLQSRTEPTKEELEDPSIGTKIAADAISPFMLPVKGEFLLFAPLNNYGPLIDQSYFEAFKSGKVTLYNQSKWRGAPFFVKSPISDKAPLEEPPTK